MKLSFVVPVIAFGMAVSVPAFAELDLNDPKQRASYMIGVDLGRNFTRQQIEVDIEALKAGMRDVLQNTELALSDEQMRQAKMDLQNAMREKLEAQRKEELERNAQLGKTFMEENKKKEGVVVLDNGMQYKVLKSGSGTSPTADDTVVTHYKGTLTDGTTFDSSYDRGNPVTFPVSGVIEGWKQALQMMKVGDKWELVIPPELAYGERGAGDVIGPNATLVFEVELLEIKAEDSESVE